MSSAHSSESVRCASSAQSPAVSSMRAAMSMFAMEPRILLIVRLQRFLEQLLECPVDVIHMHKHINPYLLKDINRDGIYVIN